MGEGLAACPRLRSVCVLGTSGGAALTAPTLTMTLKPPHQSTQILELPQGKAKPTHFSNSYKI